MPNEPTLGGTVVYRFAAEKKGKKGRGGKKHDTKEDTTDGGEVGAGRTEPSQTVAGPSTDIQSSAARDTVAQGTGASHISTWLSGTQSTQEGDEEISGASSKSTGPFRPSILRYEAGKSRLSHRWNTTAIDERSTLRDETNQIKEDFEGGTVEGEPEGKGRGKQRRNDKAENEDQSNITLLDPHSFQRRSHARQPAALLTHLIPDNNSAASDSEEDLNQAQDVLDPNVFSRRPQTTGTLFDAGPTGRSRIEREESDPNAHRRATDITKAKAKTRGKQRQITPELRTEGASTTIDGNAAEEGAEEGSSPMFLRLMRFIHIEHASSGEGRRGLIALTTDLSLDATAAEQSKDTITLSGKDGARKMDSRIRAHYMPLSQSSGSPCKDRARGPIRVATASIRGSPASDLGMSSNTDGAAATTLPSRIIQMHAACDRVRDGLYENRRKPVMQDWYLKRDRHNIGGGGEEQSRLMSSIYAGQCNWSVVDGDTTGGDNSTGTVKNRHSDSTKKGMQGSEITDYFFVNHGQGEAYIASKNSSVIIPLRYTYGSSTINSLEITPVTRMILKQQQGQGSGETYPGKLETDLLVTIQRDPSADDGNTKAESSLTMHSPNTTVLPVLFGKLRKIKQRIAYLPKTDSETEGMLPDLMDSERDVQAIERWVQWWQTTYGAQLGEE